MPLLSRRKVLAAKVEATSGTLETLTASEGAFNVFDFDMQPNITMTERPSQGTFTSLPATPETYGATVSFKTHIYGDGNGGTPAWASVFFPACGWVNSAGTFYPKSEAPGSNVKTISLGMFIDGMYKKLRGCAGNFKLVLETGKAAAIEWTFQGVWQPVTSSAIIAPTYPTALPLRSANATFTWGSWSPCWSSLSIEAGNEIYLRPCQSATDASGLAGACIVNRKVTGTFDPESVLIASYDYYDKWVDQAQEAVSLVLSNATDELTIAAPKAQIVNVQQADRSGVVIENITFQCNKSAAAGDDELTFTFAVP
jgi:hypothetical protein